MGDKVGRIIIPDKLRYTRQLDGIASLKNRTPSFPILLSAQYIIRKDRGMKEGHLQYNLRLVRVLLGSTLLNAFNPSAPISFAAKISLVSCHVIK
jgi:hypothetical protein